MADYNDAFDWIPECCGEPAPGLFTELAADYWDLVFDCLDPIWAKTFAATIYGQPSQEWYNKMNSFTYLFGVFVFLYNDIQRSREESLCGQPDYETILAQYDFSCLYNAFKCMGCKPDFAMRLFNLFNIDINQFTAFTDGIGDMYIEGGGVDCPAAPIFRVF